MGFAKIYGRLTSRIGRTVRFGAPRDVSGAGGGAGYGVIIDEVWADPEVNSLPPRPRRDPDDWGDYSFCAQLIRWSETYFTIRLAYYRRRPGEDYWEFASQTTVNAEWRTIKALLENTLAMTSWFQDVPEAHLDHRAE